MFTIDKSDKMWYNKIKRILIMSIEDEYRKYQLEMDYEMVIEKLIGGKYCGKEIDIYNIRELVVGAYYVGLLTNYPNLKGISHYAK